MWQEFFTIKRAQNTCQSCSRRSERSCVLVCYLCEIGLSKAENLLKSLKKDVLNLFTKEQEGKC